MKLYLAGLQRYSGFIEELKPRYVLESFAYIKEKEFERFSLTDFLCLFI